MPTQIPDFIAPQPAEKRKRDPKTIYNPDAPPSPEQIAQHYSAAMDSVNLINGPKPEGFTDEEWNKVVGRNKAHVAHMLQKEFWSTQDLAPLQAALNPPASGDLNGGTPTGPANQNPSQDPIT